MPISAVDLLDARSHEAGQLEQRHPGGGRPVYISADLPAPAASAKSLVFGDFKRAYCVRRVNGVTLQRVDELHSDSGHIGFRGLARVDARPLLAEAARILAHSAT